MQCTCAAESSVGHICDSCWHVVDNSYLFLAALAGAFGQVDIGLLEDDVGITATNTLDGGHGDGNLAFTIDVRIHDTKDVLKLLWNDQRLE